MRLLLIGHIVTTLLSISLTSRLSQPSSSRHEYCNFTCLSPDMPDFHVACLRVFILPPWIPFQVQPPAFYTLVAEFEARGFESTPTSESGYRTRVLWESSICDVMSVDLALHSTHWAIGAPSYSCKSSCCKTLEISNPGIIYEYINTNQQNIIYTVHNIKLP